MPIRYLSNSQLGRSWAACKSGADPDRSRSGPDLGQWRLSGADPGPIRPDTDPLFPTPPLNLAPPSYLPIFFILSIILRFISLTVAAPCIFKTRLGKQPHRHQPHPPPAPRHLLLRGCCVCNTCLQFAIWYCRFAENTSFPKFGWGWGFNRTDSLRHPL